MTEAKLAHPSVNERVAVGKRARAGVPRSSHAGWTAQPDRPDPVVQLKEQDATREPDLVPVRHGRMLVSPFTFYRGAAKIMAGDLAATPRAGLDVQLCGDAHLSNFGAFASPERILLFDVNDFDETLPGPFEYDVKRLAASFFIAGRNNGFSDADSNDAALTSVGAYREAMRDFAAMGALDIWYSRLSMDDILAAIRRMTKTETKSQAAADRKRTEQSVAKARTRDSLQALSKLAERVDGQYRIVSQPPLVVPLRDIAHVYGLDADALEATLRDQFRRYRASLEPDRRLVLGWYRLIDAARKVVGVGSVGTRAFIGLLEGRDDHDPLFLQVKEATSSVLEDHLPKSRYRNHGERVVRGQRAMQAASDIFLGWTVGADPNRHFYWRQLRDMKGSADVDSMRPSGLTFYARTCGWTLARAHARSGDPVAISAYLGQGDAFDRAIADFARRYAEQNDRDYETFARAVDSGAIEAVEGQ